MGRARIPALVLLALAGCFSACSLINGADERHVVAETPACGAGCTGPSDAQSAPDVQIVQLPTGKSCACLDAPPPDWRGPAALASGAGVAPPCGGDYATDVLQAFAEPDAPAAQCGCTCAASGVTCPSTFPLNVYGSSTCGGTKCATVTMSVGTCVDLLATNCNVSNGVGPAPAPQGTCTPQPTSTIPKRGWKQATRACLLPAPPRQETCEAGELCVPLPTVPLEARPCIFRAGDLACPAGLYSVRRVVYGDATDDRACSTCTCGSATGTCTAVIRPDCGNNLTPVNVTTCGAINDPSKIMLVSAPLPSAVTCPASGGSPTGAVTPTSPTTLCCVP